MTDDRHPAKKTMLGKAADQLKARGGWRQLQRTDPTEDGIRHTVFQYDDEELFFLGAKQEIYKSLASFAENQVQAAANSYAKLILWFADPNEYHVFDPEYVLENGWTVTREGDKVGPNLWYNINLEDGCRLQPYIEGRADPASISRRYHTLDDY